MVHPKLRCVWRRRKSIHAKLYLYYWLLGKAANNSEEETEAANPAGHSPPPSAHCRLGWLLWGTRCLDSLPGRYASSESHTATPAHTAQQSTLYRCICGVQDAWAVYQVDILYLCCTCYTRQPDAPVGIHGSNQYVNSTTWPYHTRTHMDTAWWPEHIHTRLACWSDYKHNLACWSDHKRHLACWSDYKHMALLLADLTTNTQHACWSDYKHVILLADLTTNMSFWLLTWL